MKKAVLNMADINWHGCSLYTLQLIVDKVMKLYETLIARAKRLINFFLHPKQSERLEEVQKLYPNKSNMI